MKLRSLRRVLGLGAVVAVSYGCSDNAGDSDETLASGGQADGASAIGGSTIGSGGQGTSGGTTSSDGGGAPVNVGGGDAISTGGAGATGDSGGNANEGDAGGAPQDIGSGGANDTTETVISGLTIEPNPNNVLSCYVSWTTDVAASSLVQFGLDGYQWETGDGAAVTEHRVLVIGMRPSEQYSIKAISGVTSAEDVFDTGALPATIPMATIAINETAKVQPGWTLMSMHTLDSEGTPFNGIVLPNSPYAPQAVIYDSEGYPVWYYIHGTTPDNGGAIDVRLTDKGVLVGPSWGSGNTNGEPPREVDFGGNVIWECAHESCAPGRSVSHHADKLPNGNYVLIEDADVNGLKIPIFREITPDNEEVWSLDWSDFVPPPTDARTDWCHGNSISIDIEKNEVYANCRWLGTLKTTYENPTYQWFLPAECANLGLGDVTFNGSQMIDSHDPEIDDDGNILYFDNGGWQTRCEKSEYHSRIVEYAIEETDSGAVATLIWEFPGDFTVPDSWYADWYSPFWGDADRLENGNILVAAGVLSSTMETRIFEVAKEAGEVVWELHLPNLHGAYRAERIDPPLLRAITE